MCLFKVENLYIISTYERIYMLETYPYQICRKMEQNKDTSTRKFLFTQEVHFSSGLLTPVASEPLFTDEFAYTTHMQNWWLKQSHQSDSQSSKKEVTGRNKILANLLFLTYHAIWVPTHFSFSGMTTPFTVGLINAHKQLNSLGLLLVYIFQFLKNPITNILKSQQVLSCF